MTISIKNYLMHNNINDISNFEIMPETNLDRALHLVYQNQDLQSGFFAVGRGWAHVARFFACLWGGATLLGNDAGEVYGSIT